MLSGDPVGRVLEAVSRLAAAIDRLEREIGRLRQSVEALASTIYLSCLSERLGGFESIVRAGLPGGVTAVARGRDGRVYVVKTVTVCTWDDASALARLAQHVAAVAGYEEAEVVPVVACGRLEGGGVPEGVRVVLC